MNLTTESCGISRRPSVEYTVVFTLALSWLTGCSPALAQDYTLPLYRMTILPQYLASLEANPWSSRYFPAQIEYEGHTYDCQVRFRGGSALNLPKHSWRLNFEDDSPCPFETVNLDAEYRDLSISRDYFAKRLADDAGMLAPDMRHVSLMINDHYYGVYLETEPVDKDFFERRNIEISYIFYDTYHPARFAPITVNSEFTRVYEVEERAPSGYDSLASLINDLYHSSFERLAANVERWLDVEAFLRYFALQYIIANNDGWTKNQHLARMSDGRLTVVLWDCDAAFGNLWTGTWLGNPEYLRYGQMELNVIINRLLRIPIFRLRFRELLHSMGDEGLVRLDRVVSEEFELMRHDFFLDTLKRGTNDSLALEEERLHWWLSERRTALRSVGARFAPAAHITWRAEPDYLRSVEDSIFFSLQMTETPRSAAVEVYDQRGGSTQLRLVDNGTRGDETAGDKVYSLKAPLVNLTLPVHFFFRVEDDSGGSYPYPWGGFTDQQGRCIFDLPAVRLDAAPPEAGDVCIAPFEEILESSTRTVGLINLTDRPLNLSDCTVALDEVRRCRLPELEPLAPGDTLFVTNHLELACLNCPSRTWTGGYFFSPQERDSIFLESPGGRRLAQARLFHSVRRPDGSSRVIINEVNYHSSSEFDSGDWIELTTLENAVDMSGWRILDGNANYFKIPQGTRLRQGQYLVAAADRNKFDAVWQGVPSLGGFTFKFNNSGDDVKLYDSSGVLVDWVAYDDHGLWPEEADGEGASLELTNPELSNYGPYNWEASAFPDPHGTPGRINTAYKNTGLEPQPLPADWRILSLSPNPFNGSLRIQIQVLEAGSLRLALYDLTGRKAAELKSQIAAAGEISLRWNDDRLSLASTGVYFVRIEEPALSAPAAVILLK